MKKYKSVTDFFNAKGPEHIERFIDKNLDVSQQVYALIEAKGWSQKQFASALGKKEAEVSKWLSGTHNLTLRSIAKMEAALGADIILTALKAEQRFKNVQYVRFNVHVNSKNRNTSDVNYKENKVGVNETIIKAA